MPTRARERLVQAAEDLFYAEGIHAVGVERLLERSGVGRASFYRHFASKDDLVAAFLRERDETWRRALAEDVAARGDEPLAVFDALEAGFGDDYRGCSFINAMAEIADTDHAVYSLAEDHKRAVTGYVDGLLAKAGYAEHAELAEQFVLLLDGAIVTAQRLRTPEPARRARAIAETLLANAG
ncbi:MULTISPECIES: TetR/AcrR family transcriptional regulator [Actinomadura]|uniref:TetR family transcriptional regulator n=1 Tax=Actinomadura litoris TaxID=2678616 RepID=A0A7K1KZD9_9ACTN|nr:MULTISPECIES: TetR/AcrR family transcriptional regulator [Actinomadura]MBT2212140.1 TetR/AcrR family transcriptional regulator [Actinomadura sp. NEAU-AAG7]MUN37365.1 TetR family transcriptional regulator [Actinomadura litoris]